MSWFHVAIKQTGITDAEYYELAYLVPALASELERVYCEIPTGQSQAWAMMSAIQWARDLVNESQTRRPQ